MRCLSAREFHRVPDLAILDDDFSGVLGKYPLFIRV